MSNTIPTLSDGTSVADLINLETREVQLRTLADREIYEIEQRKIFGKTWLLLGHESEIPNHGDFVQRHMGEDSVIVGRSRDNEIHVCLNVCPHRGMKITTHESGSTKVHTCIYHGWAFKPNGEFLGSPVADQCMHGKILAKEVFSASMIYAQGEDYKSYKETLRQIIPLNDTKQGKKYKVLVGFQLSQEQLNYNRQILEQQQLAEQAAIVAAENAQKLQASQIKAIEEQRAKAAANVIDPVDQIIIQRTTGQQ